MIPQQRQLVADGQRISVLFLKRHKGAGGQIKSVVHPDDKRGSGRYLAKQKGCRNCRVLRLLAIFFIVSKMDISHHLQLQCHGFFEQIGAVLLHNVAGVHAGSLNANI